MVRVHWHPPHDPLHCRDALLPVSLRHKLCRGTSFTNLESEESILEARQGNAGLRKCRNRSKEVSTSPPPPRDIHRRCSTSFSSYSRARTPWLWPWHPTPSTARTLAAPSSEKQSAAQVSDISSNVFLVTPVTLLACSMY